MTTFDIRNFEDFVLTENVMTICVSSGFDNWSAPVFYLYRDRSFFFLSDNGSEHIKIAEKNPRISVSVFKNSDGWKGLKGVQMSGIQKKVEKLDRKISLIKEYISRFPLTKELFSREQLIKSLKFSLFEFNPEKIIYTDNSIEFGFKKEIYFE